MKINILVVGAGMYVCGKGTDGYGTVLPAILEAAKDRVIESVVITSTSEKSAALAKDKYEGLLKQTGSKEINIDFYPKTDTDKKAYLTAAKEMTGHRCAIISTPDHLHTEMAKELMNLGFHLLVVKPLAPSVSEVKDLIDLQGKSGVYGAVEFHKRFDRSNLKLKDYIQSNKIGDPLYSLVEYSQRKVIPEKTFSAWVDQSNIFQYLGIHYVDILYFATRAKPLRVMAIGQENYLAKKGVKALDAIQCMVEWELENGEKFNSTFLTNWIDPAHSTAMSEQRIKVIGTKGRFEADQKDRGIFVVSDEQSAEHIDPDFCRPYGMDGEVSYRGYGIESIVTFFKDVFAICNNEITIEKLADKRPTFAESLVPVAVIDAANKSLENGSVWENVNC